MFLQQADTNSKSLLCLHWKAPSATYEAVGDMPPPSGAQQCMIPIGFYCRADWVALLTNRTIGAKDLQDLARLPFPGLVNFAPAVPYHFCLDMLATFSQPGIQ